MDITVLRICLLSALFLCQCSVNCNRIDYPKFENADEAPYMYIVSERGECSYMIHTDMEVSGKTIKTNGILTNVENAFFVEGVNSNDAQVKLFDFSKKVGDAYFVDFNPGSSIETKVSVDDIIKKNDSSEVYLFRLTDSFSYQGHKSDLIFFVSAKRGIIGSYVSDFYNGQELVIDQRGDILLSDIDYRKKEFRIME